MTKRLELMGTPELKFVVVGNEIQALDSLGLVVAKRVLTPAEYELIRLSTAKAAIVSVGFTAPGAPTFDWNVVVDTKIRRPDYRDPSHFQGDDAENDDDG